ncbi:MAG: phosphoglycerate dehydrogenase [Phycisphaerae bacterium]|nr:phosphoglycerate dehydrogenase [Phycisphaerae bacterium]
MTPSTLLLEGIHDAADSRLHQESVHVRRAPRLTDVDCDLRNSISGLGIRSRTTLDAAAFESLPKLSAVGCFCIGTNQVDLNCAAGLGIPVFNSPFSNTRSVAELVLGEVICLHRKLFDRSAGMHTGRWRKSASGAHEIRGRTLGILGYGHIGAQVSVLAEAMGMRVLYHDHQPKLPLGNASQVDSLETLLRESDVFTIHVPDTPMTQNMIDADAISKMKSGAFLLNNARGSIVDLGALAVALRTGHLAGAAIDVFPEEPSENDASFGHELCGIENVILTPHIGGSTREAQENIARDVAEKLARFLTTGSTNGAVNFPEVSLRPRADQLRILHIHHNVPGVLSRLHATIAKVGLNINAESLDSNMQHSCVLLDVDPTNDPTVLDALASMPEAIRLHTFPPRQHDAATAVATLA